MKIEVDSHTHTTASGHAYSTIIENAEHAAKKGLKFLCMTDHATSMPGSPHWWFFGNQRVIPRFLFGVGIIRGIEGNIMNGQGELDLPEEIYRHLDWVIGSFHETLFLPMGRKENTMALVKAIESGKIHAVGHPGNPNYDLDFEAIVRAAIKCNVLIEINNSSLNGSRQGSESNCHEIAALVRDLGGYITTGSDAHFATDIGNFSKVSALLAKVNMPKSQVLTSDSGLFLEFLYAKNGKKIPEFESIL